MQAHALAASSFLVLLVGGGVVAAQPPPAATEPPSPTTAGSALFGPVSMPPVEGPRDNRRSVQGGELRILNDHVFIAPLSGASALLNTSLTAAQGFGVLEVDDVDIFAYTQQFQVTAGILNRVAVDLDVRGIAAVTGDLIALLQLAGFAELELGATPKVRILTLEDAGFQLTAGLGIFYTRSLVVVPLNLLSAKAIEDVRELRIPKVKVQDIFVQLETSSLRPTLAAAEGVGPLGLQVYFAPNIEIGGTAPVSTFTPNASIRLGAQLQFDFYNLGGVVPLAITGSYEPVIDLDADDGAPVTHHAGAGLWFSGARDVTFGGAFGAGMNEGYSVLGGQIALEYYF